MNYFDPPSVSALIGAFAGAAFAFFFMQLNQSLNQIAERKRRHYLQLAIVESTLNNLLDQSKRHTDAVENLADTYASVQPPNIELTYVMPGELIFGMPLMGTLNNIDLINDLHSFKCKIDRINGDTRAIVDAYTHQRDLTLTKQMTSEQYTTLCRASEVACRSFIPFTKILSEEIITLLSKIRVLTELDKPLRRKIFKIKKYKKNFDYLVAKERLLLLEEIAANANESQAYIDSASNFTQ